MAHGHRQVDERDEQAKNNQDAGDRSGPIHLEGQLLLHGPQFPLGIEDRDSGLAPGFLGLSLRLTNSFMQGKSSLPDRRICGELNIRLSVAFEEVLGDEKDSANLGKRPNAAED
jgi:hypothetical protein